MSLSRLTSEVFNVLVSKEQKTREDLVAIIDYADRQVITPNVLRFIKQRNLHRRRAELLDDLRAVGLEKLYRIILHKNWKPERGASFETYFSMVHSHAMSEYLASYDKYRARTMSDQWEDEEGEMRSHIDEERRGQDPDNPIRLRTDAENFYGRILPCMPDLVQRDKWCIVYVVRQEYETGVKGTMSFLANALRDENDPIGQATLEEPSMWEIICRDSGFDCCLPQAWEDVYNLFRWGRGKNGQVMPKLHYLDRRETSPEAEQKAFIRSRDALNQWYIRLSRKVMGCLIYPAA